MLECYGPSVQEDIIVLQLKSRKGSAVERVVGGDDPDESC